MLLWADEILHHVESMQNQSRLEFTGESSFQGFVGGAGFRPPTVPPLESESMFHGSVRKDAFL